jgi:hypothetical protein
MAWWLISSPGHCLLSNHNHDIKRSNNSNNVDNDHNLNHDNDGKFPGVFFFF